MARTALTMQYHSDRPEVYAVIVWTRGEDLRSHVQQCSPNASTAPFADVLSHAEICLSRVTLWNWCEEKIGHTCHFQHGSVDRSEENVFRFQIHVADAFLVQEF